MFKPGDIVKIRFYPYNPDFWDDDHIMEGLMLKVAIVSEVLDADTYRIVGHSWIWREQDLIPITTSSKSNDPNVAFKFKKRSE